jgi:hypothetical protein
MRILVLALILFLVGCAGRAPNDEMVSVPRGPESAKTESLVELQAHLGMDRSGNKLGLSEKTFDSCRHPVKESVGKCGHRYLSVLNFQMLCRDSEGTIDDVVTNTKPLVSDHVDYQLAGGRGILKTDSSGYGQLLVVTAAPVRGQRLVLTVGKEFLGKEVSEVEQLVVPNYWCQ